MRVDQITQILRNEWFRLEREIGTLQTREATETPESLAKKIRAVPHNIANTMEVMTEFIELQKALRDRGAGI